MLYRVQFLDGSKVFDERRAEARNPLVALDLVADEGQSHAVTVRVIDENGEDALVVLKGQPSA